MTIDELSSEFDILYNNIMSNIAPGLTEYEKSTFLTKAQEQIVTELYTGQYRGQAFEETEETREFLRPLIKSYSKNSLEELAPSDTFHRYEISIDENFWFIVLETVTFSGTDCPCQKNKKGIVVPVRYDDYWRILNNPFKGPNERRVLRVDKDSLIELISEYLLSSYTVTFIRQPDPIILETLEGITINGQTEKSTSITLPEVLHRALIERAVELAKSAWGAVNRN